MFTSTVYVPYKQFVTRYGHARAPGVTGNLCTVDPPVISDQNGQSWYSISDQNNYKTIPFGAAHTYIA